MKKKLKNILYFVIYYSGALHFLIILIGLLRRDHPVIILFYHQVINDSSRFLDKGPAVHRQLKDFENEMKHIARWYKVISMDEVVEGITNKTGWKKPAIAVTFDDGYKDNYKLAYPVLKKYKLPAIIYLTTSLIGTTNLTWLDQIENALIITNLSCLSFPDLFGQEVLDISSIKNKIIVNNRISESLKEMSHEKRVNMVEELIKIMQGGESSRANNMRRMLDWDEVVEMEKNKILFGAHSHTHPILSAMDYSEAKMEIVESKRLIEEKMKKGVDHFAIPNGREIDFSNDLREVCKELHFKSVSTTTYGCVDKNSYTYYLKRISPSPPLYHFAVELMRLIIKRRKEG